MDLEKYKSTIEEYVDSYKKTWTKLQQQGIITKDILNYKLENLKKEIVGAQDAEQRDELLQLLYTSAAIL